MRSPDTDGVAVWGDTGERLPSEAGLEEKDGRDYLLHLLLTKIGI